MLTLETWTSSRCQLLSFWPRQCFGRLVARFGDLGFPETFMFAPAPEPSLDVPHEANDAGVGFAAVHPFNVKGGRGTFMKPEPRDNGHVGFWAVAILGHMPMAVLP